MVIRPGAGLFGWVALFPVVAAMSNAMFQLLSSRMAGLESPYTTNFYTGLVGLAVMTPVLWFSSADLLPALRAASASDLVWLLLLGGFGTAGHLCPDHGTGAGACGHADAVPLRPDRLRRGGGVAGRRDWMRRSLRVRVRVRACACAWRWMRRAR